MYDGVHGTPPPSQNGPVFLGIKNLTDDGKFNFSDIRHISEEDFARWTKRILPKEGDIVFTYEATLHRYAIVQRGFRGCLGRRLALIRPDNNKIVTKYLFYYFFSEEWRNTITKNVFSGATVDRIPIIRFPNFEITVPPLHAQRKIAAILSAYDDLIENNTRRIKILEEMAQAIYREWFVHFRFPDHENVRMVESECGLVPEGWNVARLGVHLSGLETGKRPLGGATIAEGGIPSIGAENVNGIAKHDYSAEKYVPNDFFLQMRKGIVKNRDVALYKDGAYIGRSTFFRDDFPHSVFCVNEHVFLLRSNGNQLTQNILYLWLQEKSTVNAIRATNANAAQPGINQNGISSVKVILPSHELAQEFDELVEPLLAQIINNAKSNRILRRTRDLLLPKLISGELDVSKLEIRIPEAEA